MSFTTTPRTLQDPILLLIERYLQKQGVKFSPYAGSDGNSDFGDDFQTVQIVYDQDDDVKEVMLQTSKITIIYQGADEAKVPIKIGFQNFTQVESLWIDLIYNVKGDIITVAAGGPPLGG